MTVASTPSFIISGSGINYPFDIAFDTSERLWVTNYGTGTIKEFSKDGNLIQTVATGVGPMGLAFDQFGNLWVVDFILQTVQEISTSTGVVLQTLPAGTLPAGIAIDASENVWVSGISATGDILEYSGGAGFVTTFSVGGSGLNYDLEFDEDGNLWVSDFINNTILEYSTDGTLIQSFSSGGLHPVGLAFDDSGNLWVVNRDSGTIQEISTDGVLMQTLTGFTGLADLTFDSDGNLWVADFDGNQILEFLNILPIGGPDVLPTLTINGYVLPYEPIKNGSVIDAGKNILKIGGSGANCYGGGLDYSTSLQVTGDICTGIFNTQSNQANLYKNYITDFIRAATVDKGGYTTGYNCSYLSDFQGASNYNITSVDNSKHTTINCLNLASDNSKVIQNINLSGYDGIAIINKGIAANSITNINEIGMLGGTCNFAAGDHKVYILAPNCTVNGGEGITTADMFTVSKEQAIITQRGDFVQIWSGWASTGSGITNLINVDRVEFTDGSVAFDTGLGQNAGEAYRIYKAAFDRPADAGGLGFWINKIDGGASLSSVAAGFIASAEFQQLYGANVSDRDFVTKLYNNVLDRNPDQAGFNFWLGALANGATREDILVNFSESKENIANVADLVANGIQYQEWVG